MHDEIGHGGWDVIDLLIVTQCARIPQGMRIVEFIPNSLQEESITSWNVVNDLRSNAQTKEEMERALKWLMWPPHVLLHEPTLGGKNGNMLFTKIARRFSMWRQRDMNGLMNGWKLAA